MSDASGGEDEVNLPRFGFEPGQLHHIRRAGIKAGPGQRHRVVPVRRLRSQSARPGDHDVGVGGGGPFVVSLALCATGVDPWASAQTLKTLFLNGGIVYLFGYISPV